MKQYAIIISYLDGNTATVYFEDENMYQHNAWRIFDKGLRSILTKNDIAFRNISEIRLSCVGICNESVRELKQRI